MGYILTQQAFDSVLSELAENFILFAPKRFEKGGHFSDTDKIRYGEIKSSGEIIMDEKSSQTFKEALLPITQLLFYFTESNVTTPDINEKDVIVFLRSCDLHAVKRLDEIYLENGAEDYYYKKLRDKIHFALIGCPNAFDSCFCVDMGTNRSDNYDFSIDKNEQGFKINCKNEQWNKLFSSVESLEQNVEPCFVTETVTKVNIPDNLDANVARSVIWDEYDTRCINCGRCNFSCPTCTCFTMQDIFYTENGKVGERRRVWASCMVDGYTDMAGGASYRKKNGERMRFKTLHKVLDFKQRFGYHMCVGCGRCDDVCPEYISFSNIVNKLDQAMQEVNNNAK